MASCEDITSLENWLEGSAAQKSLLQLLTAQSSRDQITCDNCKGLAFLPYKTVCGHLFCSNCLKRLLAQKQKCLVDNRTLHLKEIFLSDELKDKILQLSMKCPYHQYGCTEVIPVGSCWDHVLLCASVFSPVPCPWNCGKLIKRQCMKGHFQNECRQSSSTSIQNPSMCNRLALSFPEDPGKMFDGRLTTTPKVNSITAQDKDVKVPKQQTTTNRKSEVRFLWQVTEYHKKKYLESIGKVYFVDSELFSHPSLGHKFKIRLYLNGIGVGKGTHTSVFIVIPRNGETPLSSNSTFQAHKLKVILQNQNPAELKLHISKYLDYDPNKSRFKPLGESTMEQYGFRKFCEQSKTEHPDYLKNDTIIFEVVIDIIKK